MTNIQCVYSDAEINALLEGIDGSTAAYSKHFNQGEEFFLKIDEPFDVPSLPIHHDVRQTRPAREYLQTLNTVLSQLFARTPQVFRELIYLFDPAEIHKPAFFKIYRIENQQYLYLLRVDLMYRPQIHTLVQPGGNDNTAHYKSTFLFVEADFIPLHDVGVDNGQVREFQVEQTLSSTWIDEVGRGYFVQGIWIDHELTKFFSKLLLPKGKRTYPYYPYVCKYKTICQTVINLSPEDRTETLPHLHRAFQFLGPVMNQIETAMRNVDFSEDNKTFSELKQRVPKSWYNIWNPLRVEVYLNDQDMREFRIAHE